MRTARFAYVLAALALTTALCASTSVARADGLLALYRFNGSLADSSGHGKTAVDTGTPTFVSGAPFGGKAISFDGHGNAIVSAPFNISPAAVPKLTMGAWVRANSIDTPQYGIISNDDGNFDRTLGIDTRPVAGATVWSAFVGGTVVGKVPVTTGKWYFVAASYDQSAMPGSYSFYVNDGSKTTTLTGAANFDGDSHTDVVSIGRNPSFDSNFNGLVANAFLYRGVLSGKQIAAIIARGPRAIPK